MDYVTKEELTRALKAMTILDIILQPKEESWLRLINAALLEEGYKFRIDNGSGDSITIYIIKNTILIKGFDHENELNQFTAEEWNESFFESIYATLPSEIFSLLEGKEEQEEVTFCMWSLDGGKEWIQNETEGNDGGKEYLLGYICFTANEWNDWAKDYYETSFDLDIINQIYDGIPVTQDMVKTLNSNREIASVLQEINSLNWR